MIGQLIRVFLPPRLTIPVKIALPVSSKHTSGPPESPEQTYTTARIVMKSRSC